MIKTITSNTYTVQDKDSLIKCHCVTTNIVVSLLNSQRCETGHTVTIKKVDSTTQTVTINASRGQHMDDSFTVILTGYNEYITLVSNGNGWGIVDSSNDNDAITYRDEYTGGVYFAPSGSTAPDIVNVTIGGVVTQKYSFDGNNTTEKLGNTFEINHYVATDKLNDDTLKLEFHLHLAPSENVKTGTVKFLFDWCRIRAFGAPVAGTQAILTLAVVAGQQYYNNITGVDLVKPVGGFEIGDLIEFTITRNPADAADTYADDILLYKAALHVPCDANGSRGRYKK